MSEPELELEVLGFRLLDVLEDCLLLFTDDLRTSFCFFDLPFCPLDVNRRRGFLVVVDEDLLDLV